MVEGDEADWHDDHAGFFAHFLGNIVSGEAAEFKRAARFTPGAGVISLDEEDVIVFVGDDSGRADTHSGKWGK